MEALLTRVADYLWRQSWQIALLVLAVALASWALRHRSAHVRYLLWLLVLAKCLTPSMVQVPLAVLPDRAPVAITAITPPAPPREEIPEASVLKEPRLPASSPAPHPLPPPLASAREPLRLTTPQWLAVGWLTGMMLLLCVALTKAARTILWLRHERRSLPRTAGDFVEEAFRSLGVKRPPRVWLMAGTGQPFVWGLLRGDIYLPDTFGEIENDQHRRDIVAHEISHVLRFDAAVNGLQIVAQGIFWFHPLVWWANQRIRREREKCCDEMAIAHLGTKPKDYSSAILNILIQAQESIRPVPSLAVAGPVKNIEEKIRAMLQPGKEFYKHPSVPTAAMVVLLFLFTVPTTVVLTARAANLPSTDSADADLIFENPTNLGPTVNSSADEYEPSVSADGLELYFHSYRSGQADLYMTTRKTKADPWGSPLNLGPTVNSPSGGKGARISADGLSLYFDSDRPGGYGSRDLWVTTRKTKSGPWGEPVNLGPTVNGPGNDKGPCISADELSLYFDSDRPGGYGGHDLWVTTRASKTAPWGKPVNLGPTVNSSAHEGSPSLSGDGLSLYFDVQVGDSGAIWVTRRKSISDPWGTPMKLGPMVNAEWEVNPDISRDGSTLYFVSARRGSVGRTDIWQATLTKSTPESRAQDQLAASLLEAVRGRDIEQVRLLLAKGANANAKGGIGHTALNLALGNNDLEIVKVLVTEGVDVNPAVEGTIPPLHRALWLGLDTVRLLVDHGAKLNAKDQSGWTPYRQAAAMGKRDLVEFFVSKGVDLPPLHVAACVGDLARVKALAEQGANVDAKDELGWTPLCWASCLGRTEVAKLLVANGASVQVVANDGVTPLLQAAQGGDRELVDLLLSKGADAKAKDEWGTTALYNAAYGGNREIAEALIAKGADVNAKNIDGWTALHRAARDGHLEVAELLIAKGADVNAKTYNALRFTPMYLALTGNHEAIAELLAAKGAEVSTLPVAAVIGDLAKVKSLLEQGADINARGVERMTALQQAARRGFKEIVELLLAKGADGNAGSGSSAAQRALEGNHTEIVELLMAKGASDVSPLHLAVQKRDLAQARDLLGKGADVNQRTKQGMVPLHVVASAGLTEIAALLIDKGANVNATNNWGWTPLHAAALAGHKDMVELLLAKGANVNAQDNYGRRTALWYAQQKAHSSVVDLLQKHGAKE